MRDFERSKIRKNGKSYLLALLRRLLLRNGSRCSRAVHSQSEDEPEHVQGDLVSEFLIYSEIFGRNYKICNSRNVRKKEIRLTLYRKELKTWKTLLPL